MKKVNIIVMGKTGAGKSTLINAVLGDALAPTGIGQAVTQRNEVYSKQMLLPVGSGDSDTCNHYRMVGYQLNLYDTVGLEIDNSITNRTLEEIKKHILHTKSKMASDDIHIVWFCVNHRSSRFESYELKLIRDLSIDYEIPFLIVLTQCYSDEEGSLEKQIRKNLPEVGLRRVLAKDYSTRGGIIPAYGVSDLLQTSINDFKRFKVKIIEQKLFQLDEERAERVREIRSEGYEIISKYSSSAAKIGLIPAVCVPFIHGICIKMIADLNHLSGIKSGKHFADQIFADAVVGVIATPFMALPLFSAAVACAYIEQVGKDYMEALTNVIHLSSDKELEDNTLIKERLTNELAKLKK